MENTDLLRSRYRTAVLITCSLIWGCVLFGGVILFLSKAGNLKPQSALGDPDLLRLVIWGGGAAALIISFFVKDKILNKGSNVQQVAEKKDIDLIFNKLQLSFIVPLALCESFILLGLIFALLTGDLKDLIAPFVIGVIGFGAHFPRYSDWERLTQK